MGRPLSKAEWWRRAQQRFWSKVDIRGPDECWLWTAYVSHSGYGKFSWWPIGTMISAQRAALILTHRRAIESGVRIQHTCNNGLCCNPAHLYEMEMTKGGWWARVHQRFWSHVDMRGPNDCWNWTACADTSGYGRFGWWPTNTTIIASRAAFILTRRRAIKPGMLICHTCDNPTCCNPAHLYEGTNADNTADAVARKRILEGSRCPWAKLTESDIKAIRALYTQGFTYDGIAAVFGVGLTHIGRIVRRERWRHI